MNTGMNDFDYQDKMSEVDFDIASDLSRLSHLQIYKKNNAEAIRKFFDIKIHYEDEEELILDIMRDNTIDWNEISSKSRIPNIILYEFGIKIIWINVIYNTRLTKKAILKNKISLLNEFRNNNRVIDNINDENFTNLLHILKTLYDYELYITLYKLACEKKYVNLLQSIFKLSMISKKDINFIYYLENNNYEIVDTIIKETDFRPTQDDLTNAINNDQIIMYIINNPDLRPTQQDLSDAIKNNNSKLVEIIIDKTNLRPTQEELSTVIQKNCRQTAEIILNKTNLRPTQQEIVNIKNNSYSNSSMYHLLKKYNCI